MRSTHSVLCILFSDVKSQSYEVLCLLVFLVISLDKRPGVGGVGGAYLKIASPWAGGVQG